MKSGRHFCVKIPPELRRGVGSAFDRFHEPGKPVFMAVVETGAERKKVSMVTAGQENRRPRGGPQIMEVAVAEGGDALYFMVMPSKNGSCNRRSGDADMHVAVAVVTAGEARMRVDVPACFIRFVISRHGDHSLYCS